MKTVSGSQRFLAIYSGILTILFAVTIFGGFTAAQKPASNKASFEEINVQRINVVEPDGTLRMVISDKTRFPGAIIRGKEYPHVSRQTAGVLFFNEEGTENGGLIFGGAKDKNGNPTSGGHLSFDDYEQDQVLAITSSQNGDRKSARIALVDRPNWPIEELIQLTIRIKDLPPDQQKAEYEKFMKGRAPAQQRLYLGRSDDKSVGLKLKDAEGRDRIVLQVAPDGSPVLRFLDAGGKVISQLPQADN
jgi:hypothetical protein